MSTRRGRHCKPRTGAGCDTSHFLTRLRPWENARNFAVKARLPLILLAVLLVVFRLLGAAFPDHLPNFQPLPALLLCSLVFLDGRIRWMLPIGVWLISDPLVSLIQGYPVLGWHHLAMLPAIAAVIVVAYWLRRKPGNLQLLVGSTAAALAFYFLANTVSFLVLPLYTKTMEGFVQAQWTGPAGFDGGRLPATGPRRFEEGRRAHRLSGLSSALPV